MNLSQITSGLNDKQHLAVTLDESENALILAGAGSGKTRVLTHRIAYLILEKNTHPDGILAVTFTNKAAKEMRERLEDLLKRPIHSMFLGTFHGLAHRLLRTHYDKVNLSKNFQILDAQDQFRIIKRLMKENNIDEAKYPVRKVQWFINQQKDEGVRPGDIDPGYNFFVKQSLKVFELYEAHCQANDLIDFAELLVRSYELLNNNPEVLAHYQQRFAHILVDEFQDTNTVQYRWIQLLFNGNNKVFCVGDDDQSIYGWRGAKVENITKLETDFAPLQTIRLEQNYRSTGNILSASNALIANNAKRMGKSLWTDSGNGEKIDLYEARTETDEADYVVSSIKQQIDLGVRANECAILYRSNAQSRVFEELLIRHNIPYIIYGGQRFFERAEIKDALSYLRLVENTADNVAFERVVNFPTRGIGNATLEKVREQARLNHTNLFIAAQQVVPELPTRAANALSGFIQLIGQITDEVKHLELSEKVTHINKASGLYQHYENDKSDKAGSKKDNLDELISAAKQYNHEDETLSETLGFISLASLDASGESSQVQSQNVQLMTIHSAKGLEFDHVYLVGLEEDLFPSRQSKDEPHLMDEERRLCYVGMTRAKKKLTLSHAVKRFLHGQSLYAYPSRFLEEIPGEYLHDIKPKYQARSQSSFDADDDFNQDITPSANAQMQVGATVRHAKFGPGTIVNFEGSGDSARVQIKFARAGVKWLIVSYANLEFG